VVTAADVTRRYKKLNAALAEAGAALTQLSDHARSLAAAEAATAQLQALAASAAAAATDRVATARAAPVPNDFRKLYVGAAKTCPGLSWSVLAAIGQVESGHGRNAATSYAGAQGPMQFLPSTFAAYAVDGDHDGDTDIQDPADAIFTAAHYLCANGGGHGDAGLHNAIWHYNHAEWYVALVLKLASELDGQKPAITLGG
jgi:soluble lytic murein transglycosylase-like protein